MPGWEFPAGHYTFPFRVNLPKQLPPSCDYKYCGFYTKKASIKYFLTAKILPGEGVDEGELSFKRQIFISPRPNPSWSIPYESYDDNVVG